MSALLAFVDLNADWIVLLSVVLIFVLYFVMDLPRRFTWIGVLKYLLILVVQLAIVFLVSAIASSVTGRMHLAIPFWAPQSGLEVWSQGESLSNFGVLFLIVFVQAVFVIRMIVLSNSASTSHTQGQDSSHSWRFLRQFWIVLFRRVADAERRSDIAHIKRWLVEYAKRKPSGYLLNLANAYFSASVPNARRKTSQNKDLRNSLAKQASSPGATIEERTSLLVEKILGRHDGYAFLRNYYNSLKD